METRAVKWWGWGWDDVSRPVESFPTLWAYLRQRLRLDASARASVPRIEEVRIPPSLLSPDELLNLRELVAALARRARGD